FHARRWSFSDMAIVTEEELACYPHGNGIDIAAPVRLHWTGDQLWILDGRPGEDEAKRYRVPMTSWQGIVESWGFPPSQGYTQYTSSSIRLNDWDNEGIASFRDGTLVKEAGQSAVYVISDGVAMPVETWDAFLLMDFATRDLVEV